MLSLITKGKGFLLQIQTKEKEGNNAVDNAEIRELLEWFKGVFEEP